MNAKDAYGRTALHKAANVKRYGDGYFEFGFKGVADHMGIVELLIKNGANVNAKTKGGFMGGFSEGSTVLSFAAAGGDMKIVELLIKKGANFKATDEDGRTVLHAVASYGGHKDLVLWLIEKGANVNATTKGGRTVLHEAARGQNGNKSVVELLIQKGAKVNARDDKGATPLNGAVFRIVNEDVVEVLIKNGADVNAKTKTGRTPLHGVAKQDNWKTMELLIKNGAKFNEKDEKGQTPLDLVKYDDSFKLYTATLVGDKEEVTRLIDKGVSSYHSYGSSGGTTALHKAAQWDRRGIVKLLIEKGTDLVNFRNGDGKTPLDLAKSEEMKEILKKAGGKSGKDL